VKKFKKYYSARRRTPPAGATIRIEGRVGNDERWCWAEGYVWAGIYGFDSVFDGPGRFALDRRQLRQKCADLRHFAPQNKCAIIALLTH
jgi:hypothetical protein